ncbi:hypothetical protein K7432_007341 [Basidiobolus ranarum]|uniref:SP-RING-type domain-containing protein n=1 Tax=Basidiobolus ranarum TaxID=34480 RepID=A0ABR2W082_9FUNG
MSQRSVGESSRQATQVDESTSAEVYFDPTYATKIGSYLTDFDSLLNQVNEAYGHLTEAAVDLENINSDTQPLDEGVKRVIDVEAQLKLQQRLLNDIKMRISRGEQIPNLVQHFKNEYRNVLQKWNSRSEDVRYLRNENYLEFKSKVWEVNHPNDPMPPLVDDGEQDEDLMVMSTSTVTLKCPITTTYLEDPVTSQVCKHSFSKEAIVGHIRQSRTVAASCPVSGCSKYIKISDLKPNKSLARRVKQWLQSQEEEEEEEYMDVE